MILLLSFLLHFHNPHFFDAGEESGGFKAEKFGCPAGAINFPAGLVKGNFNIRLFAPAHVFFGQNLAWIVPIFLDWGFKGGAGGLRHGQVKFHRSASGGDYRSLDDILQFPHVAGPMIVL